MWDKLFCFQMCVESYVSLQMSNKTVYVRPIITVINLNKLCQGWTFFLRLILKSLFIEVRSQFKLISSFRAVTSLHSVQKKKNVMACSTGETLILHRNISIIFSLWGDLKCKIEHLSESKFQNILTYKCNNDLLAHKEMLQKKTEETL